ncbi:glycosyltransferase [Phocaeicola vulgatus]|uniref:glycosyltransferase n=1 Tax=Phocaeicola vulgatus TaxID=821 RepID=UPI0034A34EA4
MRILHISKYYYPFMGGVENICRYLVERMPMHNTSVLCFNDSNKNEESNINGHTVWRCATIFNIARQAISFSYPIMMRKALRLSDPDIIQYHWANPFPAFFLYFQIKKKQKLIIHWHMDIIRQWYLYWLVKPIESWLIRRAEYICVTSPQYREGSKPLRNVKSKVRIVPNAIDESKFRLNDSDKKRVSEIKAEYGNRPIVLFVGRHTKYKGLSYLIESETWIKQECETVIAGSGPLTKSLKELVSRQNKKRIHFVGKLDDNELKCYLYAASVFAFPSITKNEAFGVALAEAMYCYTPCVTFTINGSGVNYVNLHNVTGLECPNRDSKAFGEAINLLLSDNALRTRFAQTAHDRVNQNFLIRNMIAKMESVYNEIEAKQPNLN